MPLLYSAAVALYHAGIRVAAAWNPKAQRWVQGREGSWQRLEAKREALRGCLWMHCASVGEFEQGRPVLEAIKKQRPDLPVLLTFFSPSGYGARKDFSLATHVDYLPADSAANAQRLVDLVEPSMALFVKYEFWYHHLHALKRAAVPTFLISAIFRSDQPFFKWYGGAWRDMLACYTHLFTQDDASSDLLAGLGLKNVSVSGDTRFDRVMEIVRANEELPEAEKFSASGKGPVLVCGSTWPADDDLIREACGAHGGMRPRFVVAPHELSPKALQAVRGKYPGRYNNWSDFHTLDDPKVLFVDRMGLLARLYKYADIAYVGGGFGDGIHSILEAAAWGKPVIFGPRRSKFAEAQGLIDAGGGFEVKDAEELRVVLQKLMNDLVARQAASEAAGRYVAARLGATQRTVVGIVPYLK